MKEGYKDSPVGMIPEDWDVVKLGDVAKFSQGLQVDVENQIKNLAEGYSRFIRIIDYTQPDNKDMRYVKNTDGRYFANLDDIIMIRYGSPGLIGRGIEGIIANNMFKITFNELILNDFAAQFFKSPNSLQRILDGSGSSTMPAINFSFLKNFDFILPPIVEQSKIATILSSIDEKIEAITNKITATQQLKTGLMQQLLAKGIGHTKFKDSPLGEIPSSWDVHRLSDIAIINDQSLTSDTNLEYSFYYIDLTSVKIGKIDFPNSKVTYKNAPSRARRVLKNGDVLMATVRPNLLGYSIADFDTTDIICSTGFAVITPRKKTLGQFIYQSLYSESIQCQIQKLLVGSNYPAINSTDVENLKVPLPPLPEQQEISEILCTVDQKLKILQDKKTQYEQLKQGLMQQLLTGKIRVKLN